MTSDQLILPGIEEAVVGSLRVPWGGRSPRALTKAHERFILKTQGAKSVSDFAFDENQYDLWLTIKKAPWRYQGAPLLQEV